MYNEQRGLRIHCYLIYTAGSCLQGASKCQPKQASCLFQAIRETVSVLPCDAHTHAHTHVYADSTSLMAYTELKMDFE